MTTVYISIGNSDDKLSQAEWAAFYRDVALSIRNTPAVSVVHGQWVSEPASAWQNACWCVELKPGWDGPVEDLRDRLRDLASRYRQDSIAWAVADTEFIKPTWPVAAWPVTTD